MSLKFSEAFVKACLAQADGENSKLSDIEKNRMSGLSSIKLKCFLNNLCSKDNTRYLEVGVYKGATLISAAYGNKSTKVFGIDDFTYDELEPKKYNEAGWSNVKSELELRLDRYKNLPEEYAFGEVKVIEESFEKVNTKQLPKFDVIFFDVAPVKDGIYEKFFRHLSSVFSNDTLVIFSNYSDEYSSDLLHQEIAKQSENFDINFKLQKISSGNSNAFEYYSGIAIYSFAKKQVSTDSKKVKPNE